MLRYRGVVDARGKEQGDAFGCEGLHVDLIDANTILRDDLQARQGLLDDRSGDHVISADVAVELTHQREGVRFAERTAGGDDFPACFGEQLVVFSGGVLKGGGREKNTRLHYGYNLVH